MSYIDSTNLDSPSRFLDFQTPDVKNFEGLLQSLPSPSYFSFELQETDSSFRNMFAPRPNPCDSSVFPKESSINLINPNSLGFSCEDQPFSFDRNEETQKNQDDFTFFEESPEDTERNTYLSNLDSRAPNSNFSFRACEAGEENPSKKRALEPDYYDDLPSESINSIRKQLKNNKGTSRKKNVPTKIEKIEKKAEKALKTHEKQGKTKKHKPVVESEEEDEDSAPKKPKTRISMTKNYKGVLSSGLVRFLLESDEETDSGLYQCVLNLCMEKMARYPQFSAFSIEDFFNKAMDYAITEIFGKVEKESKNGKQSCLFKVGSVASFRNVFYPTDKDSKLTAVIKDIWRTVFVDHFFDSKYYFRFLTKVCKAPQQGKLFLFMKVDEIQKTLKDPYYRPDFQYDQIPLLHIKDFPADKFMEFMEVLIPAAAAKMQGSKRS